ncbi:MAG: trypsin-like peptidase domain-containing protein, partial [Planctomycetota bacterium]
MRTAALLVSVAAAAAYAQDGKKLCRAIVQVQTTDRAAERAQQMARQQDVAGNLRIHQPYTMVVNGVCISEREILTPALHPRADLHVLVKYQDGRVVEAKVKGTDPLSNCALLEVAADSPAFVTIHAAPVAVGDDIGIAGCPVQCREGKPAFLAGRVREDRVSIVIEDLYGVTAAHRIVLGSAFAVDTIEGQPNVGAACVDKEGRLVGMVVGGLPPRLRAHPDQPGRLSLQVRRFAVPASRIARIVEDLRKNGRVIRADFGIAIEPADEALIAQFELPGSAAAVTEIHGRPVAGGFLNNDVIAGVDGQSWRDAYELDEALCD